MKASRTIHRAALLTIPVAAVLGATPAQAATSDANAAVASSSSLTCQGRGVDPSAKVRYRTETFINAPSRTVWRVQTDINRWPDWQKPVTSAQRLDHGPLRKRSQFRWTTPVPATPVTPPTTLVITSTVEQLQQGKCIRWTGPAIGEGLRIDRGVHVWNFVRVRGGVIVRTEETHTGEQVESNAPLASEFLAQGLRAWLADLKTTAEAQCDWR
ncbi:SRPBCC family protein [Kibdelosporangium phytohabitans]|uniref:Polyketide cyclase /reductase n=1 Tax=Kibdelosporangium phytohabitans TaxID=860235 RepID=A0A0N9I151_9PSEU|nr:SRPBCC family protein [Kibdelosporangium phytohabitans]ALG09394.1 polyketide cyclase /reductase [Kibdelosporangium phytohabitans]MBE1469334.1 putative membrane protein [Kibdelosporangium phytohabitans]